MVNGSRNLIQVLKFTDDNMSERLAEVEISKEGETYLARIILPSGDVVTLENDDFEEVLEQIANDLQERFPSQAGMAQRYGGSLLSYFSLESEGSNPSPRALNF